jgi:putative autoinducer-2 (AI-2) aldolase
MMKERSSTMAEQEPMRDAKNYCVDTPMKSEPFFLRGSNSLDWGFKNRLSNIFHPKTGRTVMLAIDHGYFLGPTIPPTFTKGIVLRSSGGPSILKELSNEEIAVDIEDAIRLNVAAMAVQVFIGGEHETRSVHNMTRLVDIGNRYGIPVLGVTAVGKDMVRDTKYMRLATRICAELGAAYIKTYYVAKGFDTVTAACPVPIVIAGGKKLPEREALKMAYHAVQQGAAGVDMGRNIFQSEAPVAMIQSVRKVVHEKATPEEAYDVYQTLKNGKKPDPLSSRT